LKVTLQWVRPAVWRRIEVGNNITLERFHGILQVVMGWTDSHMHQFRPVGGRRGAAGDRQPIERAEERRIRLFELLSKPKDRLMYDYDFGDGWEHEVLLESVADHKRGARYPWVLDGQRACPPDDVGGVSGYAHFLRVLANPRHPEHEEMLEWCGGVFDPKKFDIQALNRAFHGGWAPPESDSAAS
jgi:hypothetical protein